MSHESLFAAVRISLALFAVWRLTRFSRKHQTLEINTLSVALIVLIALLLRGETPVSEYKSWVLFALNLFVGLLILEPETSAIGEMIGQKIRKSALDEKDLDELVRAVAVLSGMRTGALIAMERGDDLLKLGSSGIKIDAEIKAELITALFNKHAQTHDGGALIRSGRMTHCGVIFPLTNRTDLPADLGTRHRAAIGLSEHTDALCLIVSEESGSISLATEGELIEHLSARNLGKTIRKFLTQKRGERFLPFHYLRRLSLKQENGLSVSFSKSLASQIDHAIAVMFWLLAALLWNTNGQTQPLEMVLDEPWKYTPGLLAGFHLTAFILTHRLNINGLAQQMTEERRLFGLRLFQKNTPLEKVMNVSLKKERTGNDLWCLALVLKKRQTGPHWGIRKNRPKLYLIERASSPKELSEWSQKIQAALAPPLASTLSAAEQTLNE